MDLQREVTQSQREGGAKILYEDLSRRIVGCAMRVHTALGPGLLESAYEECLCHELYKAGLNFRRQVAVPLQYDGIRLDCGFRLDVLVEQKVILEIKAVERVMPIHEAQIHTYLKVTGLGLGILLNFNVRELRNGMHRHVMSRNLREASR